MRFIPITPEIEKEMLSEMGISSVEDLLSIIPESLRLKENLDMGDSLSELELLSKSTKFSNANHSMSSGIHFLGGGAYDHFIPTAVDFLSGRSEFNTAYTPYQAEVSQGTLQVMYEFQSMICELSGMDVANASLYDGASAVAEACSMALSVTGNKKVILSGLLHPSSIEVVRTYLQNRGTELIILPHKNGKTDLTTLASYDDDIACVVIQSPNYYGVIEDWTATSKLLDGKKGLLVAVSNPMDMVLLKSPGESGAHIYVGEGQSLGNPISYGGPYLGLMATRMNLIRKMPGRIAGKTTDLDGKEGFVLTFQTREQHIRRENATSNICTNQGLMALRATIFLELMGKVNLKSMIELCFNKAHYLADKISKIPGFEIPFGYEFIKEFVLKTPVSAQKIVNDAEQEGIYISKVEGDMSDQFLLLAVTEKRSKEEMDQFVQFLMKYNI